MRFAATCLRDAGSPRSAHCRATWLSGAPKRRHPAAHPAPGPPALTTDCAQARQWEAAASGAVRCRRLHTTTGAGRGRVQAHLMHAGGTRASIHLPKPCIPRHSAPSKPRSESRTLLVPTHPGSHATPHRVEGCSPAAVAARCTRRHNGPANGMPGDVCM